MKFINDYSPSLGRLTLPSPAPDCLPCVEQGDWSERIPQHGRRVFRGITRRPSFTSSLSSDCFADPTRLQIGGVK